MSEFKAGDRVEIPTGRAVKAKVRAVIVCSECLRVSCFQGAFFCEDARGAGTTERTVDELRALGREHPNYWGDESIPAVSS